MAGYYKYALLVILAGSISFFAIAQKLPAKQEVSLRAPNNIKIDGKTTEWNDEFQAYNTVNRIFYIVSNDDNNLYVTVRAADFNSTMKILHGGITFSIGSAAEKKGGKSASKVLVTFPFPNANSHIEPLEDIVYHYEKIAKDTTEIKKQEESIILTANKQANDLFKGMAITGIKEIKEPIISIYNEAGIKTVAQFNNYMRYTYELAIPLKYLTSLINNEGKFRYSIKLNAKYPLVLKPGDIEGPTPKLGADFKPDQLYGNYDTDFSSEYTLAKK